MTRTRIAALTAIAIGTVCAAFAQGPRRDGLWEVKTEMQMEGMPMTMPPTTSQQCITPAEANDPSKAAPQGRGRGGRGGQDCKVSDYKTEGNKVTWTMKCEGAQAMTGSGEIVYSGDTYTGTMKMDMGGRGAMTMKYTAKRLGDCTK
jgi:Protein of unknown function (DUF3617)